MKRTSLIAALAGFATMAAVSQDASARGRMYHPRLGRFLQRDPIGTPYSPPVTVSVRPSITRNLSSPRFTRRDPGLADPVRVGAARPAVGGGPAQRYPESRSAMPIDAGSAAAVRQSAARDMMRQYHDGMNLYQYVGSCPITHIDPRGTDRWVVTEEGDYHNDVIYPVYDKDCCPMKYRRCGFYAALFFSGGPWEQGWAVIGATLWSVKGKVFCYDVSKPAGRPTYTSSCSADRHLHFLVQNMEDDAGQYRFGHNCRNWTDAVDEYGIASDKYEQWAAYDHAMADMYWAWARYDNAIGQRDRAAYNREQGRKYRQQAAYNSDRATEIRRDEIRAASGFHFPFWAGSNTLWD